MNLPLSFPKRGLAIALLSLAMIGAGGGVASADEPTVHRTPLPDTPLSYSRVIPYPTPLWAVLQLLPSPELVVGRQRRIDVNGSVDTAPSTTWGLRWQVTPLVWSWGVHRSQSRWRMLVVDPIARHSGSIELSNSFEYIGGYANRVLVRPGVRMYFPIAQKGEYVSGSIGTSAYFYDGFRVAYDVGLYFLSGFFGFQVTVAPAHAPLAAIGTFRIRYF